MDLRNKTILAIGITFACFFIFMAAFTLPVTISGLDHLESQENLEAVLQTKAVINAETASLQNTAHDWSWWDSMYYYVQDRNTAFAEENLNQVSMENLNVHLFMITDKNGDVIFSRFLSPDTSTDIPVSDAMLHLVLDNPSVTNLSGPAEGITGMILTPEGPMILAASPIRPSSLEGVPDGTFIIGKYLESGVLSRVTEVTGNPVNVYTDPATTPVRTERAVLSSESGDSTIFIVPNNESTNSGVISFTDLNGKNILVVTDMPRTRYHSGLAIIYQFFFLFVLSAIVVAVVVSVVMDRTVLRPLAELNRQIHDFEKNPDSVQVPVLSGDDELTRLEKTIITSNKNLAESESRFRYIVETAQEGILVLDRDYTISFANDRLSSMLGYTTGEILRTKITQYIPGDQLADHGRQMMLHLQGTGEQYECHLRKKDGTFMWAILSITPITEGSEFTGSFTMITDISDRMRTQDALQQASKKLSLLSTVTFNDIQTEIFTLNAYLELEKRDVKTDNKLLKTLEKQLALIHHITESLAFAKNYQGLGLKPPVWQSASHTFLFGISHLDTSQFSRKTHVEHLEIFADPLLEKVFFSLMENVMQHSKTATEISLWYRETPEDLTLVFEDNGVGIPEEMKATLFERRTEGKRGMGLFLVKEILGITNFSIQETGVPGNGARFEITVPRGSYRFSRKDHSTKPA